MSSDIAKSVTKNMTVMMGSQVVTWISTFVLMIFLPRYLGSEEYGRLYLAMSVSMMFQVFIEFGGSYFISKEVARFHDRAPEMIVNSIGLRLVLSAGSIVLMIGFSFVAGYAPTVRALIAIFAVARLWEGSLSVFTSSFQGFEKMEYRSLTSITEKVSLTIIGVGALLMGANSVVIALIMSAATLLSFLVGVRYIRIMVPRFPRINWQAGWELARKGVPYLLMSIFAVIYYRVNAVMLSLMAPDAVVGWFGAAFRFFDILMFLPSIFSMAVFPVLARLSGEENTVTRTTQKSLDFILVAVIPIGISTFVFAGDIISLLFGLKEFSQSIIVLKVLSFGLLLVYVDFVLVTALIAMDKQRQWSIVALSAIPLSVLLNYLLIPYFQNRLGNGGVGSAVATNITELFIMGAAIVLLPKGVFVVSGVPVPLKAVIAGGIMVGSLWFMGDGPIPWMIRGVLGLVVYGVAALSLRVFQPEEIAFFRSFFSLQSMKKTFLRRRGADA